MKVHILSDMPRWKHNSILFPVYKWKKELKEAGFNVKIFYSYEEIVSASADCAIILSRYYMDWQNINKRNDQNQQALFENIRQLKKNYTKVMWFDVSDGTGSTDFDIISQVDLFAKKQLLKDTSYYTENHGRKSVRVWLVDDSPETKFDFDYYAPCPNEELHKLRLAWNLGFCDYRYFPSKFHVLSNYYMSSQPYRAWNEKRDYDFVFRGNLNYEKANLIGYQRNKVFEVLPSLKGNIIKGGRVPRKVYIEEMKNSKICVSPFGWGEVCYRDFEAFLFGCLLVKPVINYFDTFPDVFRENVTYIPMPLDMAGTQELLQYSIDSYNELKDIAREGQAQYLKVITDPEPFVQNIAKMFEK